MTPVLDLKRSDSLALISERLGNIPTNRIRLHPTPGTATEADVLALRRGPSQRVAELIDGIVVEKAMGFWQSSLMLRLAAILDAFVVPRNLGVLAGESAFLRLFPGRVRAPDLCFVSWDRFPNRERTTDPILPIAPDLVIEFLSDSNTAAEMSQKRDDYFQSGVRLYWEFDQELRIVDVYTSPSSMIRLTRTELLDGGVVLPGFSLAVSELYSELDRHG